ncbi:ubiquinone biosynthesis monooxygenase COQ6, mitochondrial [Schistocerca cancellata]|uniref:ubiquinone biosynthesis monooxygenase COQ6, mitochondrial n=1 Tax=Schistocerca cancellata TaxID=274614 RepID=UPI0021183E23|nr:ubiquinone biosynthesis monooxygenase COQ6, mitochondrial [Schistocerca cancellata]
MAGRHDRCLSNKRILLLEGSPKKEWQLTPHYSNRVSALNGGTKSLLESIGAWENIYKTRCKAVKKMQVWDALSDAMITFNNDGMAEEIAYIVENDLLVDSVSKCLEERTSNVEVIYEAKVKNCKLPSSDVLSGAHDLAQIEMEDGTSYSCRLLAGHYDNAL